MDSSAPETAKTDVPMFRENKLFQNVTADVLERLAPRPVAYEANDVIFREGDSAECLFLIDSGTVRISKAGRQGQQETLAYFQPGDFFGEMGLYGRTTRSARATAMGPVVLGCLDREAFEDVLRAAPLPLVENLLRESVSRLRETDTRYIQQVLEFERLSLVGTMVSTIIHDVRGPLSVVRMAAEMLSEDVEPDKREKYAGMVRRAVERVSDMTQEILDFSRGKTRLDVEFVRPTELIAELNEEVLKPLATTTAVRPAYAVAYDEPIAIDRSRFFRVLHNIIKNAAEAMPSGGALSITVEREGSSVHFRIADTGVGIPDDVLPHIFEPFVTHGKSGGTGLGMAIVRSVVEAHDGTIEVESTPGKGTCFTIALPLTGAALRDAE